jgi:hypothetical protein
MTTDAFTATCTITSAGGHREVVTASASTQQLADNVVLIRSMQAAGWAAFVYGSVTVVVDRTGASWTITCAGAP